MAEGPALLWFRRDLRLNDNPALTAALESGRSVIPVYVLDEQLEGRAIGGAARWWLHGSLQTLADDLEGRGSRLVLRRGDAAEVLARLIEETGATGLFFNALFEPEAAARDAELARQLSKVDSHRFNGTLLAAPGQVLNGSGQPYKVFGPFLRALRSMLPPFMPHPAPGRMLAPGAWPASEPLNSWRLRPTNPDWAIGFRDWRPGEVGAAMRLERFLDEALSAYPTGRDTPGVEGTTRLSPHLHWGELSPRRLYDRALAAAARGTVGETAADKLVSELAWREFAAHMLAANPDLPTIAYNRNFDRFPWRRDPAGLKAWTRGRTGYPIVDAGMRELWATGWMHNRVRMIVASFLVKDLMIDWREGEAWFWDTLVDADQANNAMNWQWVAGSGVDAAPFFRIYNPVTQGERFDTDGRYVRRWVPELARLPDKWLHQPWRAPIEVLDAAGVTLGRNYPPPIIDHGAARERALNALRSLRTGAAA
jgi:deoxyribodipyrimidine photo-lyase